MKNKKWLLLLIVAFPSLFWLILETSTINSRKLPHYGPKTEKAEGDTIFHRVNTSFLHGAGKPVFNGDSIVFTICFVAEEFKPDAYRLGALWEYQNYKKEKIKHVPVVLVVENSSGTDDTDGNLKTLDEHENIMMIEMESAPFLKLRKQYFQQKPYYIDYSYFALVDADAHVRGYYDARYASEMKRLIGEYQHLRIKEEKKQMIRNNEIKI